MTVTGGIIDGLLVQVRQEQSFPEALSRGPILSLRPITLPHSGQGSVLSSMGSAGFAQSSMLLVF